MNDVALELAAVVVCTPLLDASDSLDVLVDVLLEQQKIRPRGFRHKQAADDERAILRDEAWKWADEATLTVFGKMSRAVDSIYASAARPSAIFMNTADFEQLRAALDAGMITASDFASRGGMADLGISSSRHVPSGTMYSVPHGQLDQDGTPRRATLDDAAGFALPVRLP